MFEESITTINMFINAIVLIGVGYTVNSLIKIGRKMEKIDNLEESDKIIKDNIKAISDALVRSSVVEWDATGLKTHSPVSLTEDGLKTLKESKFTEVFEKNVAYFLDLVEREEPNSKFDVETKALKALIISMNTKVMNPSKEYLYDNPGEKGQNIRNFGKLAGIYIRDKYLEAHPEIKA